jgi:protein-tyrosine-phosphatase
MTRTVLFVCEHGAFRSRIAAAYFNAAAPKGWRALSAGKDPQAETSVRLGPLLAGTGAAEHLETEPLRRLDAVAADRVIALDCTVDGAERWANDAESDPALRDEIAGRVEHLVRQLTESK